MLDEARREYGAHNGLALLESDDQQPSLASVKKKWGPEKLLRLLSTKMCQTCRKKLGMYFHRQYMESKIESSTCSTCFHDGESHALHRGGDWTASQAERGLRLKGFGWTLQRSYTPKSMSSATGMWKGATELFSDETVSQAAVDEYGGVWELHHALCNYENRRRT